MVSDPGKYIISAGHARRLFLVVCMISAALFALSCERTEKAAPEQGKSLDFTLADIQGKKVTLSGLKGKVVLVEFWATWCPPCRDSVPEMNKLYNKFRSRNFELLAIAVDRGGDVPSVLGTFVKENEITYPVLVDDDKASSSFGVTNIPVIFIIDKHGNAVKKQIGFMPDLSENLSKEIEALL